MDNQQSKYFLYGALYSFSIFFILILSLFMILTLSTPVSSYTQTDNIMISVNLDDMTIDRPKTQSIEKMAEPIESLDEPTENIDELFDSIESEKIVYSKDSVVKEDQAVVDKEFLKKIQTRKTIKHEKESRVKQPSAKELELEYSKFKSSEKSAQKSGGEYDVYKAKVYALLYRGWTHTSKSFRIVKVDIHISPQGKMRYKIREVSGDSLFDSTLQAHLEYLLDTIFPISPDGKSFHFEVKFSTKGK